MNHCYRKNDHRPTMSKRDAFALKNSLQRIYSKVEKDVFYRILIEASECWKGESHYLRPWFYLKDGKVRFKNVKIRK